MVTVYNGTSTAGVKVATIDAAVTGTDHYYFATCPNGLFVVMSGADSDITVTYI